MKLQKKPVRGRPEAEACSIVAEASRTRRCRATRSGRGPDRGSTASGSGTSGCGGACRRDRRPWRCAARQAPSPRPAESASIRRTSLPPVRTARTPDGNGLAAVGDARDGHHRVAVGGVLAHPAFARLFPTGWRRSARTISPASRSDATFRATAAGVERACRRGRRGARRRAPARRTARRKDRPRARRRVRSDATA